jgi:hypothetical protein
MERVSKRVGRDWVGRKTSGVVYQTAVETPLYVRHDLKRILREENKGALSEKWSRSVGLFQLTPKILMTDLG